MSVILSLLHYNGPRFASVLQGDCTLGVTRSAQGVEPTSSFLSPKNKSCPQSRIVRTASGGVECLVIGPKPSLTR